jgi:hypothetical protein
MNRRDPDDAFRVIKRRVRDNAFRYTDQAFARMVDRFLYEEDVKRAFSTSTRTPAAAPSSPSTASA